MKKWRNGLHKLMVLCYMDVYLQYNDCNKCKFYNIMIVNCKFWSDGDWVVSSNSDVCPHWEPK